MSEDYPVFEVDPDTALDVEQLGTKRKYWFRRSPKDDVHWLFKAEERNTGEDWAEKIACEICARLGVPHATYELAVECRSETRGAICPNVATAPLILSPGNELLLEHDDSYPADETKKYGVFAHTVGVVFRAVSELALPPKPYCADIPPETGSAAAVFVGYVMLDALIANQDRHHQNWGALRPNQRTEGDKGMLAPTFDHGAALARNEPDAKRQRRLFGSDPRYNVANFAAKAASSFYSSIDNGRKLNTLDAFREFAALDAIAAESWLERLRALTGEDFAGIVARVPATRMSAVAKQFTVALLIENRLRLLETQV